MVWKNFGDLLADSEINNPWRSGGSYTLLGI